MPSWNWWWNKRPARLEAFLKSEGNDWMAEIEQRRRERDAAEKAIDLDLHQEGRQGSNRLENREIRVSTLYVEWERDMIARRLALRRKYAQECADLLSDAELNNMQASMLRGVQMLRQARRGEYEMRAREAGVAPQRPEQRDAADYGQLEAMVRREIEQLRLGRTLGKIVPPKKEGLSKEAKIGIGGIVAAAVVAIAVALTQLFGPEIRALFGFKPDQQPKP